jgi:hypothetical protein
VPGPSAVGGDTEEVLLHDLALKSEEVERLAAQGVFGDLGSREQTTSGT